VTASGRPQEGAGVLSKADIGGLGGGGQKMPDFCGHLLWMGPCLVLNVLPASAKLLMKMPHVCIGHLVI